MLVTKEENLFSEKTNMRLIIIFLFATTSLLAQQYTVVTTKGNILYGTDKSTLARGSKVDVNSSLVFQDPGAMAVLIGSGGQRFILKQNSTTSNNGSELMATIKDVLVPMKSMSALTTRGGEDHKIIDLEAMIGDENFVIVGESMKLTLDEAYYPMDEQRYFIFSYFVGKEAINKKVVFEENKLVFVPNRLFVKDGEAVDPFTLKEAKLFYRDEVVKDTRLISSFKPVVLSDERLKAECEVLIEFYKESGMSPHQIKMEINDYLNVFYGKTAREPIYHWIDTNCKL